jgi:uncharacterized protein (TIGR02246 family)
MSPTRPSPASASPAGPATAPEGLHAALEDAFVRGDLDAYASLYATDATLVLPPDGDHVHGRDAIRAASADLVSLRPHMTSTVLGKVEGDGVALTHARWRLAGTAPDGSPIELQGRGTLVSRTRPDGTWEIVLDDPLTPG